MLPRVQVVGLHIDALDPSYGGLSGNQKLYLIKKRITALMASIDNKLEKEDKLERENKLDKTDKLDEAKSTVKIDINKPIIILLPEFSITDEHKSPTSSQTKKALKDILSELTQKYPHLALYIPITTKKEASLEKSNEILASYEKDEFKIITDIEDKKSNLKSRQFEWHKNKAKQIVSNYSENDKVFSRRNTCFFSYKGNIYRLDKMAPFEEIDKENEIYKIGAKNKNTVRYLNMQDQENSPFSVAMEMCREHCMGFVRNKEKELDKKEQTVEHSTLIHLVLSGSISPIFKNISGKYFIHIDLVEPFKMILKKDIPEEQQEVQFFVNDLLENNTHIRKVKGIYPFRLYIMDQLENALQDFTKHGKKQNELSNAKKKLVQIKNIITEIYEEYSFGRALLDNDNYPYIKDAILELKELFDDKVIHSNENLTVYSSGNFVDKILNKLERQFIIETVFFKDDEFSGIRKKIVTEKLNEYLLSRKNSFLNHFRNTELTTKKSLLAVDFVKKMKDIHSKLEMLMLCISA